MRCLVTFLLTGFLVFITNPARADEEKVPLEKVPQAVKDAVVKRFPKANIVSASKETENGKTNYELALKEQGQNIDVILTPEGAIETIEKEISAKDLPKAVADALAEKYPNATYKKYEEVYKVKEGKETLGYYEVTLDAGDKKNLEVEISPEGKIKN